jgi:hypothetical protein
MQSRYGGKFNFFRPVHTANLKSLLIELKRNGRPNLQYAEYFLKKSSFPSQCLVTLKALTLKKISRKLTSFNLSNGVLGGVVRQDSNVGLGVSHFTCGQIFKLKDFFVRTLLQRFLVSLVGSNVMLCFFRNLQQDLALHESALIKLQQHRIFLLSPAPQRTQSQRDRYQ